MTKRNNQGRIDLSDWVIHFVHDRKSEDNPQDLKIIAEMEGYEGDLRLPDYYDTEGKGHNLFSEYDEDIFLNNKDAKAFDILLKILHDGFIHSGWSLRNMRPTIYGPKTAVCFTEMPLYALVQYAKIRGDNTGYVGSYGIAFRRNELFAAGGRPVIYGLSGEHVEAEKTPQGVFQGRLLDVDKTGIPVHEQYRYVRTDIQRRRDFRCHDIDWTHEREWRWALPYDTLGVPGLPFFLSKEYADYFSDIIIIVTTDEEQLETVLFLKSLYDSQSSEIGLDFDINKIASARVLSLETVANLQNYDIDHLRIEDLPIRQMAVMPSFEVTPQLDEKVKKAVETAGRISINAVNVFLERNPSFVQQKGLWGWAHVCTSEVTETTQALQNAGLSNTYADGIYRLKIAKHTTSNINLLEIGANAAADYLEKELGQHFFVSIQLD